MSSEPTQEKKWRAVRLYAYEHYPKGLATILDTLSIVGLNRLLATCESCEEAIERVSKELPPFAN